MKKKRKEPITFEQIVAAREALVEQGLLCQAHDADGKPIYRNGKPVWKITKKGLLFANAENGDDSWS